jgi:hypothetical protein
MEGCSGMALNKVPTTQHFSSGCSSHSFFTPTLLPVARGADSDQSASSRLYHRGRSEPHRSTAASDLGQDEVPSEGLLGLSVAVKGGHPQGTKDQMSSKEAEARRVMKMGQRKCVASHKPRTVWSH